MPELDSNQFCEIDDFQQRVLRLLRNDPVFAHVVKWLAECVHAGDINGFAEGLLCAHPYLSETARQLNPPEICVVPPNGKSNRYAESPNAVGLERITAKNVTAMVLRLEKLEAAMKRIHHFAAGGCDLPAQDRLACIAAETKT